MLVKEYFYNIKCDCCGTLASKDYWQVDEENAKEDADCAEFFNLGGKHYCQNCYRYDENDRIVTKDGRVFDEDTLEEIKI